MTSNARVYFFWGAIVLCLAACSFAEDIEDDGGKPASSGSPSGPSVGGSSPSTSPNDAAGEPSMPGGEDAGAPVTGGRAGEDAGAGGSSSGETAGAGTSEQSGNTGTGGASDAGTGGTAGAAPEAGAPSQAGVPADAGAASDAGAPPVGLECPEDVPNCQRLREALVHRYSFSGMGSIAVDSVSGENGTINGTELTGTGSVELSGGDSDQYVDLPNGIVSALTDATFEVWLTWEEGDVWQRIFDLGTSSAGEDVQEQGASYIYLTPRSGVEPNVMRATHSLSGPNNALFLYGTQELPRGEPVHVAVVVGTNPSSFSLYLNGQLNASSAAVIDLGSIDDNNNWLGRSQFAPDDEIAATYDEFRIYSVALTADDIAMSFAAGPDPNFLPE